ncbi:TPA: DNA cytosine methyltransferase [Salmonella enterica]
MIPAAYYNEIDSFAAQWLRNLIAAGHIAPGEVDERSIEDVTPDDLRGFTQCHFFAGIGVWSHSLRLAGWPDDKPVWTGSCPCQPFSAAGKGDGFADERHLWPAFFHLISECRPQHVFGEQVASGNANTWFDLVQADMEGLGYTFGLVPFTSAGIGAPHIRERAYWVAHASSKYESTAGNETGIAARLRSSSPDRLANADGNEQRSFAISGTSHEHVATGRQQDPAALTGLCGDCGPLEVNGFWRDADWLLCRDGKWRPVEPGTFPLVDGATARLGRVEPGVAKVASSNRVGRLKGYGNAINAQAAAEFIRAYMGVSYGR